MRFYRYQGGNFFFHSDQIFSFPPPPPDIHEKERFSGDFRGYRRKPPMRMRKFVPRGGMGNIGSQYVDLVVPTAVASGVYAAGGGAQQNGDLRLSKTAPVVKHSLAQFFSKTPEINQVL